jgi:hypothetical protein
MARDYGRISTGFWNHPKIRGCSDQAKLLATYLVSGPHSNACGAYLLPDAYVADDMGWSMATVSKAFAELFKISFARRFADGRHIVICDFLDWNPVENPNVGVAVLKQAAQLPEDDALVFIAKGLEQYAKHFPNGFGTVLEPFRNIEPNRTEPLPEPEPYIDQSAPPSAASPPRASRFGDFWEVCPKKVGKGKAKSLFERACRETSPDLIIAAMQRYAAAQAGKDPTYIAHPATWLSQRRWEDEDSKVVSLPTAFTSTEEQEAQRRFHETFYGQA